MRNDLPAPRIANFNKSDAYRSTVHGVIAGGAHTYSKGDDQFPVRSPAAIARGRNGRVWDLDGNEYVDCALALGAVSLGHCYEPVLKAVREQLELGSAYQRPADIELELGQDLLAMMPGMERVKYAKNGSNVTTAAVKLARAFTGRDLVAFPRSHPFFSFDDWFIGSTNADSGIPERWKTLSLKYDFHDPATLEKLFQENPDRIACVITEPEDAMIYPHSALRAVQDICQKNGAVFILDEMVTGFRAGCPGYYTEHGLRPDLTTWGKAIGNGFSFCALAGRADIMDLGGIKQTEAPRVFLLSSTHGGEAHALSAARAVLKEYREKPVLARQRELVQRVAEGMKRIAKERRVDHAIDFLVTSWRVLSIFRDRTGVVSPEMRTLMMQEMIGQGVLYQGWYLPCFTHDDADVAQILDGFDKSCAVYAYALEQGIGDLLEGDAARPVFRRYNKCKMICPSLPCPHEAADRDAG